MNDKDFLTQAINNARKSVSQGGFPAGAIVVKDGKVVGEGISVGNVIHDPTSHGEVAAIRNACQNLQTSDLSGSMLYSSLEPCLMCLGAAMWSSISKIIYACSMDKVNSEYYGGHYHNQEINKTFLRPIELIYDPSLEEQSLAIVAQWERSIGASSNEPTA